MTNETILTCIADDQETIVDLFVSKKVNGCCFIASVLFKELLAKHGISSDVVEGWWFDEKFMGRHYWLEIDGKIYDTGTIVLKKLVPTFPNINVSRYMPKTQQRIDNESIEEQKDVCEVETKYKLYKEKNIKHIVKDAPSFIKRFCYNKEIL